ncbi:peptidylprolyl isomerase [Chitinimonas lacunae]|uniref:Peptidyl-prolyl cis-trans isomerase n=1 Tax=Chitinimonas lacunae TaxID=1963018 RepID=A0ABV8MP31_9NEIS
MRHLLLAAVIGLAALPAQAANPHVLLRTSSGEIEVEVFLDKAPTSALNFLKYVQSGQYTGTIFHRIIPGFVVQGGGMLPDMSEKPVRASIVNEAKNGLSNTRGTLSMARTMAPHSASAQFYINLADNVRLDYRDESPRGWGYAVFGRVVRGMEVVDKMAQVPTGNVGEHQNVPQTPIVLEQAGVLPAR